MNQWGERMENTDLAIFGRDRPAPTEPLAASRCFALPDSYRPLLQPWFNRWTLVYGEQPLRLPDDQREALARLLPVLLCGEQSAVVLFHHEARRLSAAARQASYHCFSTIEKDEFQHDLGLQALQRKLPRPQDLPNIRRRAKRFFARLGRVESTAEHFAQISHLDSAVAVIMRALEASEAARDRQLRSLVAQIKRDEARHVFISRSHALQLGIARSDYRSMGQQIRTQVLALLAPFGSAFETLGVDVDRLFGRIRKSRAE